MSATSPDQRQFGGGQDGNCALSGATRQGFANGGCARTVVPSPQLSVNARHSNDGIALVQLEVSDDDTCTHTPCDVVCVLDVSYSMDSAAVMHNDSEGAAGLSLLDIVKHATRTVIETLTPRDRLAVIAYASDGRVVVPFTRMTDENKKDTWMKVDSLRTCGNTNLWDGLYKAMELVRQDDQVQNPNILLLTDGLPNVEPPRGHVPSLIRYMGKHPEMSSCRISTFGFGYNLDSRLLYEVAIEGGGHYGFIPDSSFVGTTFINATAGILSTAVWGGTLTLEPGDGIEVEECLSGQNIVADSSRHIVAIPTLMYGQRLQVLVKMKNTSVATMQVTFRGNKSSSTPSEDVIFCTETQSIPFSQSLDEDRDVDRAKNRSNIVQLILRAEERFAGSVNRGDALTMTLQDIAELKQDMDLEGIALEDEGCKGLYDDLVGQISEAYQKEEWHSRWGRHYLLSLARAHVLQQCTNFKDPGLQFYATPKFSAIRDEADDLFCTMPPPKPSLQPRAGVKQKRVSSMRSYHNSNDPCFATGLVHMADGSRKQVSEIRAGDMVSTAAGPVAIRCVVETTCHGGIAQLACLPGNILVTPWHPVRPIGSKKWEFPINLAEACGLKECKSIYSFVLESGAASMQIGSYEAVCLGHGIKDDLVASHEYLGTSDVIDDLQQMKGWTEGKVELEPCPTVRDTVTGLIVGLRQSSESPLPPPKMHNSVEIATE